jgi:hypothetical protein
MFGPAKTACDAAKNAVSGAKNVAGFVSDPLGSIAKACADAATWVVGKLADAVNATTQVDFTNPGFLREYAIVFGAATILTLLFWLLAVAKRAVRGLPFGQAVTEAVGFLWLAVLASAFTPAALALAVTVTDSLTKALASGTQADTTKFLTGTGKALSSTGIGGGPVMLMFVSLLAIAASAIIWLELLIRAAMLYVGAIIGPAVYSGLVDRSLWRHVRRWAGVMVAVDLAKPVIVIVLGLAAAVTASGSSADAFSSVLAGLAIMFLSIFVSVAIYRFVPTFGDDMAQLHAGRRAAAAAGPVAAVDGPATFMRQGVATHAHRGSSGGSAAGARAGGGAAVPGAAAFMAAGMAAHGVGNAARHAYANVAPATSSKPTDNRGGSR